MLADKAQLRERFKALRASISGVNEKNCQIMQKVLQLSCVDSADAVFCYVSMGTEVDTHALIRELDKKGKAVYVPHVAHGEMLLCRYEGERLSPDRYGNIFLGKQCVSTVPPVTIVPLLAFDERLYRLGYGKGYYDRFLSGANTVSVGLAFEAQCCADVRQEAHDVPLDMIVTEHRIIV